MANIKISQLPSWSGTAADLRWFVMNNSAETETFKFSGYTSPLRFTSATNIKPIYSVATLSNNYDQIFGGQNNTITASDNNNYIFGGEGNNIAASRGSNTIAGGVNNTINSNYNGLGSMIVGGYGNTLNGGGFGSFMGGGYNNYSSDYGNWASAVIGGESLNHAGGGWSFMGGGKSNTSDGVYNTVLGGQSNSLTAVNSFIVGGKNNTIGNADSSGIINSTNTTQNANPSPYSTSGVTMIGCVGTDITNANNSVVLGVSGRTINAGGESGRAYMDKPYILGNIIWDTTTVNNSGTININVFTDAVTVINVTGGTYDLTITPIPNDPGTEVTLMINYVSGTVNFVGSGSVQWRWGNGLGAPTFSANTRSIIKLATWAGNDLWEISRSMNMS